jgi:translocation and assembly module TamB
VKRWRRIALLVAPLLAVLPLGWLLGTEAGLRAALARTPLEVAAVRGSLAGGFVLEGPRLALGRFAAQATLVEGDLEPLPLLVGKVHLASLRIAGLRATLAPDPDPQPLVLPENLALPLPLAIDALTLDDAQLALGGAAPLVVARARAALTHDARGTRLAALELEAAPLTASGSLALGSARPFPVEGALALALARAAGAPVAGRIELSGRLEALAARFATDAPLATRGALTLDDPFATKRIEGELTIAALALDELAPALGPTTLDATLRAGGTAAALELRGQATLRRPGSPALEARFATTLAGTALEVGELRLQLAGHPTRADLGGRIALDGTPRYALRGTLHDLATPDGAIQLAPRATLALDGEGGAATVALDALDGAGGSAALRATRDAAGLRATLAAPRWRLPAGTELRALTASASRDANGPLRFAAVGGLQRGALRATVEVGGRADERTLELERLVVDALGGRIDGRLTASLAAPRTWRATLAARDLDPAALDVRLPGRLGFRATLDGDPQAATLELASLQGSLRELPLAGSARLRWRAPRSGSPDLERLELTWGGAAIAARHDAARSLLEVRAPDLAPLWPGLRGRLALHAERDATGWRGSLEGAALRAGALRIARAEGSLAAPADGEIAARLALSELASDAPLLDAVTLEARGPRDALTVELAAHHGGTRADATLRGAWADGGFVGTLERFALAPVGGAPWRTAAASSFALGADGLALARACASDGTGQACLEGGWRPREPWRTTLAVDSLPLAAFRGLLPRGLEYRGRIALDASLAGRGAALDQARAELGLGAGAVVPRADDGLAQVPLLEWSGGHARFAEGAGGASAEVALELGGHGELAATLRAAGGGPFGPRPLSGRISGRADRLALLPVLLPELQGLAGTLRADLTLAGTVAAPRFAGEARFEGGRAKLPRYGVELEALEVVALGDGDQLKLTGSARGGGSLRWDIDLARRAEGWRAEGRVSGERFRALDVPEARVIASPDLSLTLQDGRLVLRGTLGVPEARIAPRSLATAALTSDDEVLVGDELERPAERGLKVDARVKVVLGQQVRFDGFGLGAKVSGEVTLVERPGALALANGELALAEGRYEAYGQKLAISRGRLLFSGGPAADPGLDVRAQRTIERAEGDVTVGIDVRGTLRRPETELFSDPALSPSDQLSYLVLGHPLTESTAGEQRTLGDAADAMRLSGGEYLAQQLGQRLGLDEVRISDAGDQSEAQLWLGTWLSPRLFVSYGVGIYEQIRTARVRYQISSKWSVEAESGRENSADFKYTIER